MPQSTIGARNAQRIADEVCTVHAFAVARGGRSGRTAQVRRRRASWTALAIATIGQQTMEIHSLVDRSPCVMS